MIRRQFLLSLVAAGLNPLRSAPRFKQDPFALGIASGDPLPDSVVLWTRLAGAELGNASHEVDWVIAEDEGLLTTWSRRGGSLGKLRSSSRCNSRIFCTSSTESGWR